MNLAEILLVLGMALVTFAVRYPILALVSRVTLPPSLLAGLKFIPPAVLTAIILPMMLVPNGETVDLSLNNVYLVAGIITAIAAWRTRNLLLTLAVGMAAFWGWRMLLAWSPYL